VEERGAILFRGPRCHASCCGFQGEKTFVALATMGLVTQPVALSCAGAAPSYKRRLGFSEILMVIVSASSAACAAGPCMIILWIRGRPSIPSSGG